MIKTIQIAKLSEHDFTYITAITKLQIKTLLEKNTLQMEMFDDEICEVECDGVRYLMVATS